MHRALARGAVRSGKLVHYDGMEITVISSIGDTAASLGLISTLVFSIAVTIVLSIETVGKEGMMMCLCVAISTSIYTTTHSLLEYYYTANVKGLSQYIVNEENEGNTLEPSKKLHRAAEQSDLAGVSSTKIDEERALTINSHGELMMILLEAFASFNTMRQRARNATWVSISSICFAALFKIVLQDNDAGQVPRSRCWSAALFFGGWLFSLGCVHASSVTQATLDIKVSVAVSAIGLAISSCTAYFYDPDFDMPKLVCSFVLVCGIAGMAKSVKAYREVFMPFIKQHATVH
ncbi:unnamed protein product [Prorocentrum cordatum]|uniref:H(+)-exporting diphosphatase n=1 Tax=Prorocentrum cordatum TaxID=2364126 RepID=A0ABN9RRU6_9DINO|nr:unnamed protein product [Polarella glacialis]